MTGNTTITSSAKDTGPLDWRIAIVDKTGRPTQEFQRKWATQRANNALIGSVAFGTGAPTGSPADGAEYIDTTKEPWVLYIGENNQWNIVGVQDFINLDDVPGNYTSSGDHLVRVNGNATGLEFVTVSTGLDGIGNATGDILVRGNSTWTVIPPGNSTTVLTSNGSTSIPSWQAPSGGGGGGGGLWDISEGVPALSTFTQTNLSTGTVASEVSGKALTLITGSAVNNSLNTLYTPVPSSTPYRIAIFGLTTYNGPSTWPFFGWCVNSPGNMQIMGVANGATFVQNYSSPTSFSGQPFSFSVPQTPLMWYGLRDDGTNIYFEQSQDGVHFVTLYTTSKSSGFLGSSGYTHICWGLFDDQGSGNHPALTIRCYDPAGLSRSYP